ncbi:MAG: hypothetical protein AB7E79_16350 [Rhodospirillaceae bacterium]
MRRFALAACLLISACDSAPPPAPAADTTLAETHGRQNGDYYDYLALGEINVLAKAGGRARREETALILALGDGRTKTLQTRDNCLTPSSKECTLYHLMALWPSRHAFLVHKGYYQGGDFLLIDDRDGQETVLTGLPIFGPDPSRFVVLTADAPGREANIEIYRIADGRPEREWSAGRLDDAQMMWRSLRFVGWDESGINVEVRGTVSDSAAQTSAKYLVAGHDGEWRVTRLEAPK